MQPLAKSSVLKRLKRIEGQVRGLSRMVEDDRYCIDIVTQLSAARAALAPGRGGNSRRPRGPLRRARDRVRQQGRAAAQGRRIDRRALAQRPMKEWRPAQASGAAPATRRRRGQSSSIGSSACTMKPAAEDGLRILIDRLWPRGLSKAALQLDAWPRALAPSTDLRKWYGHDPALFAEFRRRYRDELAAHQG